MKKKCKHKYIEIVNEEIGGYNIPEGCTTEYDLKCKECREIVAHWAYGSFDDPDDVIKYQTKGRLNKLRAWIKYHIFDSIRNYFLNKRLNKICKNNDDLPF